MGPDAIPRGVEPSLSPTLKTMSTLRPAPLPLLTSTLQEHYQKWKKEGKDYMGYKSNLSSEENIHRALYTAPTPDKCSTDLHSLFPHNP